jgi:hypothetical protein
MIDFMARRPLPINPIEGVPDAFIQVLNSRFRMLVEDTSGAQQAGASGDAGPGSGSGGTAADDSSVTIKGKTVTY